MVGVGAVAAVAAYAYYTYPTVIDTGYQPVQPVPYSHKLHAGQLGLDCFYCHSTVYKAAYAAVPADANLHELPYQGQADTARGWNWSGRASRRASRFRGCIFTCFPTSFILTTRRTSPPA